jgi:hypothetical protein
VLYEIVARDGNVDVKKENVAAALKNVKNTR